MASTYSSRRDAKKIANLFYYLTFGHGWLHDEQERRKKTRRKNERRSAFRAHIHTQREREFSDRTCYLGHKYHALVIAASFLDLCSQHISTSASTGCWAARNLLVFVHVGPVCEACGGILSLLLANRTLLFLSCYSYINLDWRSTRSPFLLRYALPKSKLPGWVAALASDWVMCGCLRKSGR